MSIWTRISNCFQHLLFPHHEELNFVNIVFLIKCLLRVIHHDINIMSHHPALNWHEPVNLWTSQCVAVCDNLPASFHHSRTYKIPGWCEKRLHLCNKPVARKEEEHGVWLYIVWGWLWDDLLSILHREHLLQWQKNTQMNKWLAAKGFTLQLKMFFINCQQL